MYKKIFCLPLLAVFLLGCSNENIEKHNVVKEKKANYNNTKETHRKYELSLLDKQNEMMKKVQSYYHELNDDFEEKSKDKQFLKEYLEFSYKAKDVSEKIKESSLFKNEIVDKQVELEQAIIIYDLELKADILSTEGILEDDIEKTNKALKIHLEEIGPLKERYSK